jgi:hypothetical protein
MQNCRKPAKPGRLNVASIQPNTHSFVVKVWLVESSDERVQLAWHGRITHVPSGRSYHFTHVNEISLFVTPYLHQLGIKPTRRWKFWQWLCR